MPRSKLAVKTTHINKRMKYSYLLLDLDGTVTNSMTGITRSVQYALKYFGIEVKELGLLQPFIGPPLKDSFKEFYHFTEEQAILATSKYHEYFSSKEEIIRETLLYTFHKEFDNFCGLLQFEQGFEAGFRQILTVMEKALSQFSPFQTLMSSVGKRELKQYVSEEAMENIMRQMIRLIDLLLEGVIEPQRPREYQRFVLIGVMQAYCFQITNPQLQISAAQAADYAWQGLREALA